MTREVDDDPEVSGDAEGETVRLPSHSQRIDWHDEWEEKTREHRELAARDREYFDGHQWTADEIRVLEERGQPVLTKNRIARKINYVAGDEVERGVDPVVKPRTPDHDDEARAATDAMRQVEEAQDFDAVRSLVFRDMLVEGCGGAVVEGGGADLRKVELTHVPWDRLWWDPHRRSLDCSDAKYLGVIVWMDLDDAQEKYPASAEALESAVNASSSMSDSTDDRPHRWVDGKRKRVKIIETYFHVGPAWYMAVDSESEELEPAKPTPYVDETGVTVCPLVVATSNMDADGMPYGLVRGLISAQDEINKRSSKSLHLLNVNGVIAEQESVPDPQEFQTELAKPDGFAEVRPGALRDGSVQVRDGGQLAAGHLQLLQEAKQDIDTIGPSSATMPDIPQGASGRAFIARQKAASKELAPIFASLRRWDRAVFRQDWLRIRQFWTEEIWVRVDDDRELTGYRFVALNRSITRAERFDELLSKGVPFPKALSGAAGAYASSILADVQRQQQMAAAAGQPAPQGPQVDQAIRAAITAHPMMQQPIVTNQVATLDVDITIDEAPETTILAEEQFDKLMEMLPAAQASGQPIPFDLILELSSFPRKREIIDRLSKSKPQPNPQAAALQQQMAALQAALQQALVEKTKAETALRAAEAAKTQAETQAIGPTTAAEVMAKKASAAASVARTAPQMTMPMGVAQRPTMRPPGGL